MVVLAHEMCFLELFQLLHAVAAYVADSNARLFGILMGNLYEFLATLLRQIGHPQPDDLPLGLRIKSEVRCANGLLDGNDEATIPDLDLKEPRLGNIDGSDLVERHGGAVGLHMDGFQETDRRPAGPQAAEIVFQGFDGSVHAALQFVGIIRGGLGHGFNPW